ncbi:MAG: hypothetical protein P1U42_04415 [Phycisphaerales bacterium]|nr:hypothetical protein [Phycisphaerales bacterium]
MFAKDRDLVVLEPGLHRDIAWMGQRLLSGIGSLVGTALSINSGSFVDAGIESGHVVLFDDVVLEVVSVESDLQATVSLMRADTSSNAIPGIDASNQKVEVYGYGPQIGIVHRQVLGMIGINVDDENGLSEDAVTNPGALVRLEALGALHLIYSGAGASGRNGQKFDQRARMYRERFASERERVIAMIDLNGDGIAESTRRPNAFVLDRA